ncbi:type III secretion protein HrpB4 [Xylophilus sp. GOD-11R]|uniref:type III secretion protein HrpB4 n=1 Tax=Xylophilus sp. GOD-11R TaxID=3089814 RepID=UPI00298CA8ED|nr:type III secretion protein HrpB4 [Xylophilus sp. GOD-11R]WPB57941.1 type III secretion protein HrpB4 [Xylophilus sp. GOD-11R]
MTIVLRAGTSHDTTMQRFRSYAEALRQLPSWVHPSWRDSFGIGLAATTTPAGAARLAVALGVETPDAEAFDHAAHRIAALPSRLVCRVLRTRGLLRHRPALRRCLDQSVRGRLAEWVHPTVFETILRESSDGMERDADGLPLPGAEAVPDSLAWEGFCLFERDGVWSERGLLQWLRLGFAKNLGRPSDLDDFPGARDGSAWVVQRLDRLVPEAPWLCG